MQVTLKFYATLADYLPAGSKNNRVDIEVDDGATVSAIVQSYALPPKLTHLVLVNGVFVPPDERATTCLQEGDVLAIWPPIAGG